jgi:hypothetical protein
MMLLATPQIFLDIVSFYFNSWDGFYNYYVFNGHRQLYYDLEYTSLLQHFYDPIAYCFHIDSLLFIM